MLCNILQRFLLSFQEKKQIDISLPYLVIATKTKRSGENHYPPKRMHAHLPSATAPQSSRLKRNHQRSDVAGTTPFGTSSKVFADQRAL
jgi:hypothetical protein